jgi:small nuclear ribonucleoprotein (snRNP)-like protein
VRISKDERLQKELNSRVFADRKNNEEMRGILKEIEEKRQN